jgi:hypothetical protein
VTNTVQKRKRHERTGSASIVRYAHEIRFALRHC